MCSFICMSHIYIVYYTYTHPRGYPHPRFADFEALVLEHTNKSQSWSMWVKAGPQEAQLMMVTAWFVSGATSHCNHHCFGASITWDINVYMGMDQYLLIPFLGGWTSIYQLFWCSPGVQGFDTLPYHLLRLLNLSYVLLTKGGLKKVLDKTQDVWSDTSDLFTHSHCNGYPLVI